MQIQNGNMDNFDLNGIEVIYKDWFETLKESRQFVLEKTERMEPAPAWIKFNITNEHTSFVENLAFVDLDSLKKHEFIITVNNGVYEVIEETYTIVPFYEYCKWGNLEKFKDVLLRKHSPEFIASGFSTAIHNNQLEVVKFFVENDLISNEVLYASPLNSAASWDCLETFRYLSNVYEPKENLLPYILERNAVKILRFVSSDLVLKEKIFDVTLKDKQRIERALENERFNNAAVNEFKNNLINALTLHN